MKYLKYNGDDKEWKKQWDYMSLISFGAGCFVGNWWPFIVVLVFYSLLSSIEFKSNKE